MKISLVTTVKNEAESVPALLDAIRSQTRKPDEWIVVDGGSSDGTVAPLESEPLCRVRVRTGNIAQGRNHAIAQAAGEIIVVTDAGCRPSPRWLESLVVPLEAGRGDFTAGPTRPRIERPFDAAQWTLLDQFFAPHSRWRPPTVSSRSLAFFRTQWEECPYPEWLDVGEDRWMVNQWLERGRKLLWVDEAEVEWALRPTLPAFAKQHFRYMRGDGRANMRVRMNLARLGFYVGLTVLAAAGWVSPALFLIALAVWLAYFAATLSARFPGAVKGRPAGFALRAFAWTLPALLAMDLAKMAGYLLGTMERLLKKPGSARE